MKKESIFSVKMEELIKLCCNANYPYGRLKKRC